MTVATENTTRSVEKIRVTRSRRNMTWTGGGVLVVVVVLALFPYIVYSGTTGIMVQGFIILTLASMWNLLAGFAGLVSIGQQAFFGLGAYAVLMLAEHGVQAYLVLRNGAEFGSEPPTGPRVKSTTITLNAPTRVDGAQLTLSIDVALVTDRPILGHINSDPAAIKKRMSRALAEASPWAESFRVLRTNMQYVEVDHDRRVFVVSSSLPEEGKSTTASNLAVTLANATAYLEAAGHVVVAWLWLEQALATRDETAGFYEGKRAAARYFHRYELPKVHTHLDLLESLDRTVLDTDEAWL